MGTSRRESLKLLLQSAGIITAGSAIGLPAFDNDESPMLSRTIPSSGEKLPVIGLGTWQTFDVGSDAGARDPLKEVLTTLITAGGKVVDSSPMYGRSEKVVGELAAELGIHKKLFMATKVWTSGRPAGVRQMDDSFSKMRVKTMDLMQVHNLVDVDTHMATLKEWKAEGKIRYTGITHYTSGAFPALISAIRKYKPDFVQFNYNIADLKAEEQLFPVAKDNGVATIINRPFGESSLFSRVKGKSVPAWAREYGIDSWAQYFLKFIISHPDVTCAIPGTSKPHHMADNASAGRGLLPDANARRKMVASFRD